MDEFNKGGFFVSFCFLVTNKLQIDCLRNTAEEEFRGRSWLMSSHPHSPTSNYGRILACVRVAIPFPLRLIDQHQKTFLKAPISSCFEGHCFASDSHSLPSCDSQHHKYPAGNTKQMRGGPSLQRNRFILFSHSCS